jgi:hypothetical protein
MENNYYIHSYDDLDREEIRVKKRLKVHEKALKEQFKTLPEEIVSVGTNKIISGVLNGDIFKSTVTIVKTIGSLIFSKDKDSSLNSSIIDLLKEVFKKKFED